MSYEKKIKSSNLSVTSVRIAMLESLTDNPHSDANELFNLVKEKIKTTSIQAIYKNLNILTAHGLIREIKLKGLPARYETRVNDNHHHIVCRSCGDIRDAECLTSAPCLTSANPQGYKIDEAEITFWGTCPDCQNYNNKGENNND